MDPTRLSAVTGSPLQRLMDAVLPPELPSVPARQPQDRADLGGLRPLPAGPRFQPTQKGPVCAVPAAYLESPQPLHVAPPQGLVPVAPVNHILRPATMNAAPTGFAATRAALTPTPMLDERQPPISQARDLQRILMTRIIDTTQRSAALTMDECRAQLGFFAWSADKLEALSQRLEAEGNRQDNAVVEAMQRDLQGAIHAFEQIHAGTMRFEQFRTTYSNQLAAQRNLDIQQTAAAMAARRAATITAYGSMRYGYNCPPPPPPMLPAAAPVPGAPLPGAPLPGAPLPGASLPGAPLPGAPLPGVPPAVGPASPAPVVQTVYIPYMPAGYPYPGMWHSGRVHIDVPSPHHGRRDC